MEDKDITLKVHGGKTGAVMVVGGGVSGIQASLDLANSGYKVYLVEEGPAIGGKMAQLDKTFPTNDCSMCILSPKFIELARNQNIEILTLSTVEGIQGEAGNFNVLVRKKPRYIDEEKCNACGTCVEYCPVKISDPYNENLNIHRCIYIPFPQAVPALYLIDPAQCVFMQRTECKICAPTCKVKAIDFKQQEKQLEIEVGAVILAPGYEKFDPETKSEYGYGTRANIVTSLEFERMLSASGPFKGEVKRPSDKKHPKKIAWMQCIGSRDTVSGNTYCSAVCCMYSTKQLIIAKEHDPALEATIFYNDIRAYGKGFERYYERAKAMPGVRYIWNMPAITREIPGSKNIAIRYVVNGKETKEEEFDLVVLSVGLCSTPGIKELANKLSVDIDKYGFCKTDNFTPVETSRPGIYVSGVFRGPMDIPESVMTASGAAAAASQLLSESRGTLMKTKEYPPERDISGEEPRVGVFVCHCGTNIAGVVSVPKVVQFAKKLPDVVHAEDTVFACSIDSAKHISETIKEKGLNRVVVAACTPRTHEPVFQETLREAGLNPFLYEQANIREHCSWVHMEDKKAATLKAQELVRMAVAKVRLVEPLQRVSLSLNHTALVIGGGIAGMTSALNLADQGFEVHLVEKESHLGGMAKRIHYTLEGSEVQPFLHGLIKKVKGNSLIHVHTGSVITKAYGCVGNFVSTIGGPQGDAKDIEHGVAILAIGGQEFKPNEYLYGKDPRVLTQLELEDAIVQKNERVTGAQSMVMIQCVGSRDKEHPYCSRICCSQAIKNAIKLKEVNPEMEIYVLHRDMRTYSLKEDYYREAAERDVKFIRFDAENKPQMEIAQADGKEILRITVVDRLLGELIEIDADILTLSTAALAPSNIKELSQLYKVPVNEDGFFLEAHMKLRPVDFATDGVFMCGLAHNPKLIEESIAQARAAASRATTVLAKESVTGEGIVCYVNKDVCGGCGVCEILCPYSAITVDKTEKLAEVNAGICKGCGTCAAACPSGAAQQKGFRKDQISSMISAALEV
ncbi:MAG: CoB--CoM heterodisulfide reductase iron-sulfur subunit A family protein [Dehalococcoidia bacterium]|nr:CoB--CoM heterodisulfide reductase iron-sulfur subunit A family protein [Dehalococcoidia bacterium]